MDGWVLSMHEYEWRRTNGWMSMHEYKWRMNKEELKDEWVCMNMNGGWMSIHEYEWRINEYTWIWMEDE